MAHITNEGKPGSVLVWEGGCPPHERGETDVGEEDWQIVDRRVVLSNGKRFGLRINSSDFYFSFRPLLDVLDLTRKIIVGSLLFF